MQHSGDNLLEIFRLSRHVANLHIAGRSALDRRGIRHFLYVRERVHLRGTGCFTFPFWAKALLLPRYEQRPLFDSRLDACYAISALPMKHRDVMVSHRERAIIELLADSGRGKLEHATDLISELRTIRPLVLQTLADHCLRRDLIQTLLDGLIRNDFGSDVSRAVLRCNPGGDSL
jgi:hypothetical protein